METKLHAALLTIMANQLAIIQALSTYITDDDAMASMHKAILMTEKVQRFMHDGVVVVNRDN